jgi:tripartite-type tricarboxylate transporter receptor subunit TctC
MRLLRGFACAVALCVVAASASAQDFPSRPLTLVAPFPAGGPTDSNARLIAKALSDRLGQPVIVENKPGAGGIVGTEYVVNAKPDGYTLLYVSAGPIISYQFLYKKLSYDPQKGLIPLRGVADTPLLLMVRADAPYRTLADFMAQAKTDAGKINYATLGRGSANHLLGELLQGEAGIKMTDIPYKGTAPSMADLLAGTIEMMFDPALTMKPQIDAGKLRPLAVSSAKRIATMPDIPTFGDQGFPGVVLTVPSVVLLPAGTPQPVVDTLADVLGKSLDDPALVKHFEEQGVTSIRHLAGQELADWLAQQRQKAKVLVERARIEPE